MKTLSTASSATDAENTPDGLPPGIIAMELTFRCTACRGRVRIDARAQGCYVHCPRCGAKTTVPMWSTPPELPGNSSADGPVLTPEEVAFLATAFEEKPTR